jgi:peptidoglycan/xylan/chitin deacetylase (PgdA/CDA1 family)
MTLKTHWRLHKTRLLAIGFCCAIPLAGFLQTHAILRQAAPARDAVQRFLHEQESLRGKQDKRRLTAQGMIEADVPFSIEAPLTYSGWQSRYVLAREDPRRRAGFRSCVSASASVIYLSFDDGPRPVYTRAVVDALARHRLHAVFFVLGRSVDDAGRLALRTAAQNGDVIGSHTYNHPEGDWFKDRSRIEREILANEHVLEGVDMSPYLFRFPSGRADEDSVKAVRDLGYTVCGWDIDSYDWCFSQAQEGDGACLGQLRDLQATPFTQRADLVGWIQFAARQRGGGMILMHDTQYLTASDIDEILDGLLDPERYWKSLPNQLHEQYGRFYRVQHVDPTSRFQFGDPRTIRP